MFWFYEASVQRRIHQLIRKSVSPHQPGIDADPQKYIESLLKQVIEISKEINRIKG